MGTLPLSIRGARLSKASKDSQRRIDAAVSCLMAFDRATVAPPAAEKVYHVYEF